MDVVLKQAVKSVRNEFLALAERRKSMKKIRVLIMMVISATLLISSTAYAQDLSEFKEWYSVYEKEELRRLEEIANSPDPSVWLGVVRDNMPLDTTNTTRSMCVDCNWFGVSVCARDATLYTYGYHRGLLGIAETDCLTYYYKSRGAEMCPTCLQILWLLGEHDCIEHHTVCSKRIYEVCILRNDIYLDF